MELARSVGEGNGAAEVARAEEMAASVVKTVESVRGATEATSDVRSEDSTKARTGESQSGGGDVLSN